MNSDATSSDEENLAAYAGVAVSGETVKAHAVTAGEKAAKVRVQPSPLLPESVRATLRNTLALGLPYSGCLVMALVQRAEAELLRLRSAAGDRRQPQSHCDAYQQARELGRTENKVTVLDASQLHMLWHAKLLRDQQLSPVTFVVPRRDRPVACELVSSAPC